HDAVKPRAPHPTARRSASTLAVVLTICAQPTNPVPPPMRADSSAAGAARFVIAAALIFLTLCLPIAAHAGTRSPEGTSGSGGAWPWPLSGEVITSYRNGSDPYAAGQHRGLDIAAPEGAPVLAIVGGRISYSGRLPDGGEAVTITSGDGRWLVSHLHLSARAV